MTPALDTSRQAKVVAQAQAVLSQHAKSFQLASLFLPKEKAADAAILYQFCRLVDDAVDEADNLEQALQNIQQIRREIAGKYSARPAIESFVAMSKRLAIPKDTAKDLIKGVMSDLGQVRIQTDKELAIYCYRVAGVVGRMMCCVIGVNSPKAIPHAIDLGIAMQITNICRDVMEDADRDRIYIPANRMKQANILAKHLLLHRVPHNNISAAITELLQLAEQCYRRARLGMHYIPFRTRIAILIASRVYRAIGRKLQRTHGANPMHGRTVVSKAGKFWQVFLGLLDAFHPVTLGWVKPKIPPSYFYQHWSDLQSPEA